jgi:hypothetical protein
MLRRLRDGHRVAIRSRRARRTAELGGQPTDRNIEMRRRHGPVRLSSTYAQLPKSVATTITLGTQGSVDAVLCAAL